MQRTRLARQTLAGMATLALAASGSAQAQGPDDAEDRDWGVDISLILEGIYFNELSDGNEDPAGFAHDHGHEHDHDHSFDDGFNLGHSEIALEARLGDLLDGTLLLAFDEDDIEVEEAYLTTRSLPAGLQLKGGRFLSDIGYVNSRHPHDWDFVNRPMVNEYLFGDHGLHETGIQATWVAPTRNYTQFGFEILQGDNTRLAEFSSPSSGHDHDDSHDRGHDNDHDHADGHDNGHDNDHDHADGHDNGHDNDHDHDDGHDHEHDNGHDHDDGHDHEHDNGHDHDDGHDHEHDNGHDHGHNLAGEPFSQVSAPRLFTVFAKTGPDLGPDHALQLGTSAGYIRQIARVNDHGNHAHALEGDGWFAGLDLAYRYSPGRAYGHGDWRVTGEYFHVWRDLREFVQHDGWIKREEHRERQDGLYLEAVYGFAPRWQAGLRTEALGLNNRVVDFHPTETRSLDTSYRHSAQVTFRPVEPVFLRAQLTQDDFAEPNGHRDRGLNLMLQVNVALGSHGAHRF